MIDLQERFSERKNFFNRLVLVYILFGILFGFVIYNTYSLQVSSFSDYEIAALKNKSREILVQPKRGIIYDRNGKILVNNEPSYNLIFKPSQVTNLDELINEINIFIPLNEKDISLINKNFKKAASLNRELTLKQNLSQEEISKFKVRRLSLIHI